MLSAAAVLVCAIEVLGRSPRTMPPIQLVDIAPVGASADVEAYVWPGSGTISVVTSTPLFRTVQRSECRNMPSLKKLASVLVHEEWHVRNGSSEEGAYGAQLGALVKLGVDPASALFSGVVRSMQVVTKRKQAERIVAASLRR
jgi:hypothetical protein